MQLSQRSKDLFNSRCLRLRCLKLLVSSTVEANLVVASSLLQPARHVRRASSQVLTYYLPYLQLTYVSWQAPTLRPPTGSLELQLLEQAYRRTCFARNASYSLLQVQSATDLVEAFFPRNPSSKREMQQRYWQVPCITAGQLSDLHQMLHRHLRQHKQVYTCKTCNCFGVLRWAARGAVDNQKPWSY